MEFFKLSSDRERIVEALKDIGVDDYALSMSYKAGTINILVKDLSCGAANIIKQEALGAGMDAAVAKGVVNCSVPKSDVLLLGNMANYKRLFKRLKLQPFGLKELGEKLLNFLSDKDEDKIIARDKTLLLDHTITMGIINTTPDSFSDGNTFNNFDLAKEQVLNMVEAGVEIIDIGGMSSRPGSDQIDSNEEIKRIEEVLKFTVELVKDKNVLVSVDTNNYETAEFALKNGAHIINDIAGLRDENMIRVCAEYNAGVCIMHMLGEPRTMQQNIQYDNLLQDIKDFLLDRIRVANSFGIKNENIILDPGFGFGKSVEQNYVILKFLEEFNTFKLPILAGISRKSMLGAVTGRDVKERLSATVAANTAAILNGAKIIRVHDYKEGIDTAKIADSILKAKIC